MPNVLRPDHSQTAADPALTNMSYSYCSTLDTQVCLLFVRISVHLTDNTRLDLIVPGEQ